MKTIKFRGKRNDNREWVYGLLTFIGEGYSKICVILSNKFEADYRVIPKTVGQLIGPKDKQGKDIYEGDIYIWYQPLVKNGKQIFKKHTGIVGYTIPELHKVLCISESMRGIEVIGNIHENSKP